LSSDASSIGEGGGLSKGLTVAVSIIVVLACGATAAGLVWWRCSSVPKGMGGRDDGSSVVMARLDAEVPEPREFLIPVPL
jgi:hypothetical protein